MILIWFSTAWLVGTGLAASGYGDAWPFLAICGALVSCVLVRRGRRSTALLLGVALLLGLAGLARYEAAKSDIALEAPSGDMRVAGIVTSEPEHNGETQRFRVRVESVLEADSGDAEALEGETVSVTRRTYPEFARGDLVELTGEVEPLTEVRSEGYRAYLEREGVVATLLYPDATVTGHRGQGRLSDALAGVRHDLGRALERSMPEPEAALAKGMLLGQRDGIPRDVETEFNSAGISHLIVISGANIMIVAGFVVGALRSAVGRKEATVLAMAAVIVYAVFVGGSPPVLRAVAMAIVVLGAVLCGRGGFSRGVSSPLHSVGLNALLLAGVAMTMADPGVVADVSFQLSFAATLGIVMFTGRFEERLEALLAMLPRRLPEELSGFITGQLALTGAASIAVVPIIAVHFGRLSLVSVPANLIAAPVFVFALGGAGLTSLTGAIDSEMGAQVGEIGRLPISMLVWLAAFAANLPVASVKVDDYGAAEAAATYGILLAGLFHLLRRRPHDPEETPQRPLRLRWVAVAAGVAGVAAAVVWWGAVTADGGELRVTVLDVGQGDAILIEAPGGYRVLVDGGPSGPVLMRALGEALPDSERDIDLVVLTHGQDDHLSGLVEMLRRYEVAQVLEGPLPGETGAYAALQDAVRAEGAVRHRATPGQRVELGDGAYLDVLAPEHVLDGGERNNNSVVLRLVYGKVSFLLTGDLAAEGESALLDSGFDLRSTVLKVGHHGSDGSTTRRFLDAVLPVVAVVSAGSDNPFGHPAPGLRLRLGDVPLFRTDLNGSVRFETDGSSVWVTPRRGGFSGAPAAAAR